MKDKTNYQELRDMLKKHPKYPGTIEVARSPLINDGFPGTFNLSMGEQPMLDEFGRYQYFDRDVPMSVIQRAIRPNDVYERDNDSALTKRPYRYLGVFELGDLTSMKCLSERENVEEIQKKAIHSMVEFMHQLGIAPSKVYPSYCAGGKVKELTDSKYDFDFYIPEDSASKEAFLEAGIPKDNLIPNKSRDTLLSLVLSSGSIAWGYRNELDVDYGLKNGEKLDFPIF